jgi:hypothetical protein
MNGLSTEDPARPDATHTQVTTFRQKRAWEVKRVFCAGLGNLALRLIGKPVPKNPPWNGGTGAWKIAYGSKMVPFRLDQCREGDVAFRPLNYAG